MIKQHSIEINYTLIIIEFNSKGEELKARVLDEYIELKKISSSLESSLRKYLAGAFEFIQHTFISHDTVPQRLDPCEADVRGSFIAKYKF